PTSADAPAEGTSDARVTLERVDTLIEEQLARANTLDRDQQIAEVHQRAEQIKQMDPESVDQMATLVEKATGASTDRAWAPDPAATGDFDPATAIVYDMRRVTTPEGQPAVRMIFVDAEGRFMTENVSEPSLPSELRSMISIYESAAGNPNLRRLLMTAQKAAYAQENTSRNQETP
ncbi:MAG: hypothetical protein R3336_08040, partial [Phycisphaeraceae bacterium]|nr:hypothetical protein [Phycisphaeraceae bacterium]